MSKNVQWSVALVALVVLVALSVATVASALSATVTMNGSQNLAVSSAAIGISKNVQWKGWLSSASDGYCYYDLMYGTTSSAGSVRATKTLYPGGSFGYMSYTGTTAYYWKARMNTPGIAEGRIGSSTVYIP